MQQPGNGGPNGNPIQNQKNGGSASVTKAQVNNVKIIPAIVEKSAELKAETQPVVKQQQQPTSLHQQQQQPQPPLQQQQQPLHQEQPTVQQPGPSANSKLNLRLKINEQQCFYFGIKIYLNSKFAFLNT